MHNHWTANGSIAEDGAILRLYEGAGLNSTAAVNFNLLGKKMTSVLRCDARERNLSALQPKGASVDVSLKPLETCNLRVRFETSR
jgi:Glycosyl hydrolases family 38 C-terminal beta sandwich domain